MKYKFPCFLGKHKWQTSSITEDLKYTETPLFDTFDEILITYSKCKDCNRVLIMFSLFDIQKNNFIIKWVKIVT